MKRPNASIAVHVDVTNPGQFFACCGLLELADRLWPGAEGWFESSTFCMSGTGSLPELLQALVDADICSSVGDNGLKRLGTLMSAKKSDLTDSDQQEKEHLRALWQEESLELGEPFNLEIDWWRDEKNNRTALKTWAAKQLILDIVRPLLSGARQIIQEPPFEDLLQRSAPIDGLPLFFDAHAQSQSTALDTGFSTYDLRHVIKEGNSTKPALELLAFIGLQRFKIPSQPNDGTFHFNVWNAPLSPLVAAVAASNIVRSSGDKSFQFRLLSRTKYMKAFLPATPTHKGKQT